MGSSMFDPWEGTADPLESPHGDNTNFVFKSVAGRYAGVPASEKLLKHVPNVAKVKHKKVVKDGD